jgi:carbonic anhydrase/acetyltransferase-like protein (isoleucine patch superfamily)
LEPLILPDPEIDPSAFVAPDAQVFGNVTIGARAVLMFGVVARAEFASIAIGEETNLQDHVVLHVDEEQSVRLGRRVTVGHQAVVHGAAVGDRCLVGIGARVLNGASMGEGSWIASGSLLPEGKRIPEWTLAVGIPAKPLRELTEEEIKRADEGVEHYLRFGVTYRQLFGRPPTSPPQP